MRRNMKVIYCLTALFTGMTFCGCGSDNDLDSGKSGKERAWVSFSISLPKTGSTKAADANDLNADAVETVVNTVDVWLQNAGTNTSYTKIVSLNKDAFPGTGSTYTAQAVEVDGTAGDANRNLFVAINAPASYDPNTALASDKVYKMGDLSDIQRSYSTTANEGFIMFNAEEVKATLHATEAAANTGQTIVPVERMAGKAMLSYNQDKLFAGGADYEDVPGGGHFKATSLKWQVRNANNKVFLIKDAAYKDPNYTFIAGNNDFASHYEKAPYSTSWMDVPANNVAPTTGYDNTNKAFVQYFPENTNEIYVEDNTTHLSVQVAFVPKELVTDYANPDNTTPNTSLVTFYYNVAGKKYYSQTAYNAAIAAGTPATDFWGPYTNGICYYYVPIGTDDLSTTAMLGAKRNHFYKMKINSMTAPGNPTPGTVDPEVDPENPVIKNKVWIAVQIDVEAWQDANAEVDLK